MLGPPDGRYLLRDPQTGADGPPAHVVVLGTLGAPERRRLSRRRQRRSAPPQPAPAPVSTARATVIDLAAPFERPGDAQAWLERAGDPALQAGIAVLNRTLHAFRHVTANPNLHPISLEQALVARLGYGAGEDVAEGMWTQARELASRESPQRRIRGLAPQARLAAILSGRESVLACQELALRARLDLGHGRPREAALQVLVALDAALAELASDPVAAGLAQRLGELRGQRDTIAHAAQAALSGPLDDERRQSVELTLGRIEAALRARAAAYAQRSG